MIAHWWRARGIGTQLTAALVAAMVTILAALYAVDRHYESLMMGSIRAHSEGLSKALQLGVQELTSRDVDEAFLREYVESLALRGVNGISVLRPDRTVVASSSGRRGEIEPPGRFIVTGRLGEEGVDRALDTLEIPVIVNDQKQGYLRLQIYQGDFADVLADIRLRRAVAAGIVTVLGAIAAFALAARLTAPLRRLSAAADAVGRGDLDSTTPPSGGGEIGRLERAFSEMVGKLRENRRLEHELRRAERSSALANFAAAMAHEIRNPINYINLSAEYLRRTAGQGQPEIDRRLAEIREEIQRIDRLVNDFLSFGRPQQLRFAELEIELLIRDVLALVADRARESRIEVAVKCESRPRLRADADALRRCLLNLVTNAIQAMPTGGRLAVSAETAGADVEVDVEDTGIGVPAEKLAEIFAPYFSTKEAGVGLGLAITRRLIEDHGGRIDVESRPGATRFRVRLPIAGPAAALAAA